jgi:Ca2+-binding RTX toxin-like protein
MLAQISVFDGLDLKRVSLNGDAGHNEAMVFYTNADESRIRVTIDDEQRTFNVADIEFIGFYGGDGNDRFENQTSFGVYAFGYNGNDELIGGSGDDFLHGQEGEDILKGRAGDDLITGGEDLDYIDGGGGADSVFPENSFVYTGVYNDTIVPGGPLDRIQDVFQFTESRMTFFQDTELLVVQGDEQDNYVRITELDDGRIRVQLDDQQNEFEKSEIKEVLFKGLDGDDTFINNTHLLTTAHGNNGADRLIGGWRQDMLHGGDGDDVIRGRNGHDILGSFVSASKSGHSPLFFEHLVTQGSGHDEAGNDYMDGGPGRDFFLAGEGNDRLIAGIGMDYLDGGAGDDFLKTYGLNDDVRGREGDDTYSMFGGFAFDNQGNTVVRGSNRPEEVVFSGSGSNIHLGGGDNFVSSFGDLVGDHRIQTGSGQDTFDLSGRQTNEFTSFTILTGAGNDTVDLTMRGNNISTLINLGAGDDTVVAKRHGLTIYGGSGDDHITGSFYDDEIFGQGGIDTIYGSDGDDLIDGGADNDVLFGEEGDDTIYGRAGDDILNGGMGMDILYGGPGDDEENQD